jgi:hypothetical protein
MDENGTIRISRAQMVKSGNWLNSVIIRNRVDALVIWLFLITSNLEPVNSLVHNHTALLDWTSSKVECGTVS